MKFLAGIIDSSLVSSMFSEIVKLMKTYLTIPISMATTEISFSALWRKKNIFTFYNDTGATEQYYANELL